jgi:fumarate reductase flavoprotein subunit
MRSAAMPTGTPKIPALIVGAGACGQTAAIRLRQFGVSCLILERDALPSGSTALSSGFIPAAETDLQRSLSIQDSIEQFKKDIIAKSGGQAAKHLVEAYTEGVKEAINAFCKHGIGFEIIDGFLYPGHSALRMHTVPQRTGDALLAALGQMAQELGADLILQAKVTELWADNDNTIIGVGYLCPDGKKNLSRVMHCYCPVMALAVIARWSRTCFPKCQMLYSLDTLETMAVQSPGGSNSAQPWRISDPIKAMDHG